MLHMLRSIVSHVLYSISLPGQDVGTQPRLYTVALNFLVDSWKIITDPCLYVSVLKKICFPDNKYMDNYVVS